MNEIPIPSLETANTAMADWAKIERAKTQPLRTVSDQDPLKLAVEIVEEALKRGKRAIVVDIGHELPGALDRLAVRRYAVLLPAVLILVFMLGFATCWLWTTGSMSCDTVTYPGWRHCTQWIGGPGKH